MPPWNSAMIRYCAANPSSSRGGEIGPLCALLRMKPESSEYVPPCLPFEPSAFALTPRFCLRIFPFIARFPDRRERSSTAGLAL